MKQGLAGGILLLLLVFSFSGLADARNQFSITKIGDAHLDYFATQELLKKT